MAKKNLYDFYGVIDDNVVLGHRTPIKGSHNIAVPEGVVKIWSAAKLCTSQRSHKTLPENIHYLHKC